MDQIGLSLIVPLVATAAVGAGLCGIVAILSPRTFRSIATFARRGIDTSRWLAWLDKSVDVDKFILRHARIFGLVTLAGILFAVWLIL